MTLPKTNRDKLVMLAVLGEITPTRMRAPYRVSAEGEPMVLPAYGTITYNVRIGQPALEWVGDHIEPGVSIKTGDSAPNNALRTLSCVGNEARVVSGEAKGASGRVTGSHAGVEHVLVDFAPDVLDKLTVGDKIQVKAWGQGMKFTDPELANVKIMNCDPRLFEQLVSQVESGLIEVPVVAEIPSACMGSGIGEPSAEGGDLDIQTSEPEFRRWLAEEVQLRLGDLVLIKDYDCRWGFGGRPGAWAVGVVIHCDSIYAGHGPGVRVLLTSKDPNHLRVRLTKEANIVEMIYRY